MLTPPDPRHPDTVLLFDLDGTITDSFAGIANSFRHALAAVDAPEPDPQVVAGIVGPPMIDTLHGLGLAPEVADEAMRAYRERYTEIGWRENAVYDGMPDVLADLSDSGRTMAVATSKNQTTAHRILEHFGLTDHFKYIAGASDDGTRRHKADVIAHAVAELGLPVDADTGHVTAPVVMIGDRSHDVHGAATFGISAVLVRWGYSLHGEEQDAAWTVESTAELRDVLGM
ncbi:HAD hydrolase-like protein [Gordonia rubripertincta]|uniref:HAD hydrolase-like protein n=1 Tax=Gordonia rubripertincta TaxID=36822 RepID=UPI0015FB8269|nr:HAD hydrolase-like protein [Gordonia rubripertincta]QMU19133.1 HAD hydrolase-like protein [Gordonia rubripertincta]